MQGELYRSKLKDRDRSYENNSVSKIMSAVDDMKINDHRISSLENDKPSFDLYERDDENGNEVSKLKSFVCVYCLQMTNQEV